MANFASKPTLDIHVDAGTNRASIHVSGAIVFNDLDRQLMAQGLVYTLRGSMKGQDQRNSDFLNIALSTQDFTGVQSETTHFTIGKTQVSGASLNEDAVGKDEVFALLTLTSNVGTAPVATVQSNQVAFFFRNR